MASIEEAYRRSIEILRDCSTPSGFVASPVKNDNYLRVWGRDSMVCSMAALATGDSGLVDQVRRSIATLFRFQHKHGNIPSNVDVSSNNVSYGGSTGRVDATLWCLIGLGQYVRRTQDVSFARKCYAKFKKAFDLVHLYEFNDRGLIYVPKSGDWADEYVHEGYVLYDQLLYYKAMREYAYLRRKLGKNADSRKSRVMADRIRVNYWLQRNNKGSGLVYSQVQFMRAIRKGMHRRPYLLPAFHPGGYSDQFDGLGNALALHFGVLGDRQESLLHGYVQRHFSEQTGFLLPAFHPPIREGNWLWNELRENYKYSFKNAPYEYHNGGLWPMITGFYAAALARRDVDSARKFAEGIARAVQKKRWRFSEFIHGKTGEAMGQRKQAWSAAGMVLAKLALEEKRPFL